MDMTVWTMLSSQIRPVQLVVANFSESQIRELNTRARAKLGFRVPKLYVYAPRREEHRSTNTCQESVFLSFTTETYGSFSAHV